ncbi:MAG: primosomal protein N' [Gammaproteobacteria bacterium]|nr:primosomal protein N' [Gammaproteobacteria bacterium]
MSAAARTIQIAIPAPLRKSFDYLVPADLPMPAPGARVRVPFGPRRTVVGVVLAVAASAMPLRQLKPIVEVLDDQPLLPPSMLQLLCWAADYYHHPIGEVIATALPARLRRGEPANTGGASVWTLTAEGAAVDDAVFKRALIQQRVWRALKEAAAGLDDDTLAELSPRWRAAIDGLAAKGWASGYQRECLEAGEHLQTPPPSMTAAQTAAVDAVVSANGFRPFLLHGVTGSGKTEVYLRVIDEVLRRGQQALVLVPEISLTPQLAARFRARFREPVAVLHSEMTDAERACAWLMAHHGKVPIVLGTRSAVFTPLPKLGVIVVDEEHDASYKQQDGFRYSARDVAMLRANRAGVPIVLGSATPSLETLQRVRAGAYTELDLPDRAGGAAMPTIELLDLRRLAIDDGLSHPLRTAISETVSRGEQVLLFLNRRGFAPVWMCYGCGWVAPCQRCDARLTYHRASSRLRCHHCGADSALPATCPGCRGTELNALGEGTERIETALKQMFATARIVRIDRDSVRAKGALEATLESVHDGHADILVGTQMLSKGHDFPNVTLVGVLNADQGLYGSDFRAGERLVQQIIQVSGRAGRAAKAGRVLIQTYHPDHPVFTALRQQNYQQFADYALTERGETGFPPFSHLALLRAESPAIGAALAFLRHAHALARACMPAAEVQLMDPMPSPMERRAGRYRAQLLVQSRTRAPLHALLSDWLERISALKEAKRVRWSLDVDPIDTY